MAFFDIDGVLSIPQYRIEGKLKAGGSKHWWKSYCLYEYNPYKDCKVPKAIKEKLKEFKEQNVHLYVLSQENINEARDGKIKFINNNYNDIFDAIVFVEEAESKPKIIAGMAAEYKVPIEDVYYVDDTFALVIDALTLGIDAHHISEFLEVNNIKEKKMSLERDRNLLIDVLHEIENKDSVEEVVDVIETRLEDIDKAIKQRDKQDQDNSNMWN